MTKEGKRVNRPKEEGSQQREADRLTGATNWLIRSRAAEREGRTHGKEDEDVTGDDLDNEKETKDEEETQLHQGSS